MRAASGLLRDEGVTADTCPLCGTSVALLRRPERRSEPDQLRERIAALRACADRLEHGEVTPRQLKDEALWMCAACQRIMVGRPQLDRQEIQRRIHAEVRTLERRADTSRPRAS